MGPCHATDNLTCSWGCVLVPDVLLRCRSQRQGQHKHSRAHDRYTEVHGVHRPHYHRHLVPHCPMPCMLSPCSVAVCACVWSHSTLQSLNMIKYWRTKHVLLNRPEIVHEHRKKRETCKRIRINPDLLRWSPLVT